MTEKVTMEDIRHRIDMERPVQKLFWRNFMEPLIERYADQAREDERAEAQLVIDDLREQLERALVPKFKGGIVTGCTNPFHSHMADVMANLARMSECTFAPPPEKCRHTTGWGQPIIDWYREIGIEHTPADESPAIHCFKCGEPLTASTKEEE